MSFFVPMCQSCRLSTFTAAFPAVLYYWLLFYYGNHYCGNILDTHFILCNKKKNSNLLKRQKKLVAQCFWKKWTWKHHFNPRFCVRESVHTCIILRVVIISIILLIWILGAVELHKTLYKPPPSPLLLQKEICLNSIIHCLCLQEFLDDFANAVNSQFGCLLVMGKVAVATERWCVAVHCFNYQFVL